MRKQWYIFAVLSHSSTLKHCRFFRFTLNSLWPSDAIWQHRSGSTLAQVMACCLTAPSHYLNQCSLIISEGSRHLHEANFTGNAHDIYPWYEFENYQIKTTAISPRGQWVKEDILISLINIMAADDMVTLEARASAVMILTWFTLNNTSHQLYRLTHWGRDKMAAVSQTTLSNSFSWMKMLEFRLRFHWSLFLRVQLTIFQHWLR